MTLKLNPEPTFKATARIPVPGGESEPITFTFEHRTAKQIATFTEECRGKSDLEVMKSFVVGWALDDAFNDENLARLIENYPGATGAIIDAYYGELTNVRRPSV